MDILNNKNSIDSTSKPQIENLERQKEEYKLIAQFIRTRGLKLFGYNHLKDELFEVEIKSENTISLVPVNNKLVAIDTGKEKVTVDSRFEYFEALKRITAIRRLENWKSGKIKVLCNLKRYNSGGIGYFINI